MPHVIEQPNEMYQWTRACQSRGETVGVVPTMGALHAGHLSLARQAGELAKRVVVTIFVNPTQFGPHEDFERYPRDLQRDLELLEEVGVDCVFSPAVESMYPPNSSTSILPPRVAQPLEGQCRPGHFEGVCTVVLKLLQIIPADVACFGQKDFQQALVIKHMVQDLNVATQINVCPTVREADGLAMSSRNAYLSQTERQRALSLSRALRRLGEELARGQRQTEALQNAMAEELAPAIDRLDYAVVADPETLECPSTVTDTVVGLIAAQVGGTRLIDNARFRPTGERMDKNPEPAATIS